ncbi:thiol:disulfide interchange protein DsbA precursor [bacterium BMS3Bbin06]|nr:thiol:disulfide interchange protein DsbA precursor [bacterium BMS3Abin07]GBE32925.1 thiol:disulfide interchange protein DsbA precursor [bacterium BMS3Bbin05]GBE34939.1 thiol:disulfide interchange protein DsbA precursor [bacterium BMS3Bbin06]HDO22260.1 hypothetical protein [Nitrospirota bacterium]HDZ87105.1 hypothetical protein [Nitrospirota bacterium]
MKFKRVVFMLFLFVFAASPLLAEQGPSIKGVHTQVPGFQYNYNGKTVGIIQFLSFYCGNCYAFEASIPVIKGNFPKKTKWKAMFIYWGKGSSKPSEAYLLAEDAGKGEQMRKAIFNANFVQRKDIGNIEVLEDLAKKIGLGSDFNSKLRSGAKAAEVRKALQLAKSFRVEETPTLIIAGNIMTTPHSFNHNADAFRKNVITIISSIVKK